MKRYRVFGGKLLLYLVKLLKKKHDLVEKELKTL